MITLYTLTTRLAPIAASAALLLAMALTAADRGRGRWLATD
jgi:hypothetical protein